MAIEYTAEKPNKSTAVRMDAPNQKAAGRSAPKASGESIQASPVDTPSKAKRGRPKTDFDKAEYNRQFMRDLRTINRLGLSVTVAEWRKTNEN